MTMEDHPMGEELNEEFSVFTFGASSYGQLGQDTLESVLSPVSLSPSIFNVFDERVVITEVSGGTYHTLFLADTGDVFSCGDNRFCQCGQDTKGKYTTPRVIMPLQDEKITQISCGAYHSIVLSENGNVYTFGNGNYGRLGRGSSNLTNFTPVSKIEGLQNFSVAQVVAGGRHCMILTDMGSVLTFGCNEFGQLGNGTTNHVYVPTEISLEGEGDTVIHIAACAEYSMLLTDHGNVYTFGCNKDGQLGHNNNIHANKPNKVHDLAHKFIVKIAAGGCHSVVLSSDGEVYAAGHNTYGQLGSNGTVSSAQYNKVLRTENLHISSIAAGDWHSVLLSSDKKVYTFGNSGFGQLGHGVKIDVRVPQRVNGLEDRNITKIAAGYGHTIVLTGTDSVASTYPSEFASLLKPESYPNHVATTHPKFRQSQKIKPDKSCLFLVC